MQSTLRLASRNGFRNRTNSVRQLTTLRNDLKQTNLVPALGSNKGSYNRKYIHTASGDGPLCQVESVKEQLKQVSNVDAPERIRQAWFHPEFPVEKMTELLVSIIFTCNWHFYVELSNIQFLNYLVSNVMYYVSSFVSWIQDHDNHEMRANFRNFISEPVMVPRYNISLAEERDLALRRLQRICDNKFISVLDFWHNPLRIFAAHELAAIIDPAMTTKMTVQVIILSIPVPQTLTFLTRLLRVSSSLNRNISFQFNLFGGTVLKLGTDRHHKDLLEGIDNLNDIGCFGLTELGYGNNAVEMETTATYDKATKEFIVNTPHPLAQKYWITNGAIHAKHIGIW